MHASEGPKNTPHFTHFFLPAPSTRNPLTHLPMSVCSLISAYEFSASEFKFPIMEINHNSSY